MIHLNLYIFIIYISKKLSYNLPLLWSVLSSAVRIKQLCFFFPALLLQKYHQVLWSQESLITLCQVNFELLLCIRHLSNSLTGEKRVPVFLHGDQTHLFFLTLPFIAAYLMRFIIAGNFIGLPAITVPVSSVQLSMHHEWVHIASSCYLLWSNTGGWS
jgi:hypothetical protein